MKKTLYKDVVITDYGSYAVNPLISKAYLDLFGKKRKGKFTKRSEMRAYDELCKDVSGLSRLSWIKGDSGIPRGFIT